MIRSATIKLRWASKKPVDASVKLRHPYWSDRAIVLVNGVEAARSDVPGTYVELARNWRNGDQVELQLSMEVGVSSAPAAPDIVAFTYGPLVLAGALGRDGLQSGSDIIVNERKYGEYNNAPFTAPMLAGETDQLPGNVRPGERPLEFTIPAADGSPVRLIPYHNIAHERYATYWKVSATAT